MDPSARVGAVPPLETSGSWSGPSRFRDDDEPGGPAVTRVEILPLQPGDRVLVHVNGAAGMSAGGGEKIGRQIRALLGLDELGFGVPVLVVSPGIEVQVIRPS